MDKFSFLNAAHSSFFSDLYDRYCQNPDTVEPSWRAFFQGFDFGSEKPQSNTLADNKNQEVPEHIQKEFKVINLINGYRGRGHLFTKTNPVRKRRSYTPDLAIENFGLSQSDLDKVFNAGRIIGVGAKPLRVIVQHLEKIYCDAIGTEYMYIRQPEERHWIQNKLNQNDNHPDFSTEQKKKLLQKLVEAVTFESFLHSKYVGQKRFSLEGGESLIPALDSLIEKAADYGVKQFVMGMAHRGRLNTLANIFGKPAKDIFSEFDGKDYATKEFDGDVKYHLGWTSKRVTEKKHEISINLAPNPSHLETVSAVVQGITRAKQEQHSPNNLSNVLPIIVHGDAAIAGQGIVYEVVQMANLNGYKTHGTIHIVVNNQIGFTTNYLDARSSTYCTDIAKVTLSPVMHVNADDVEAVVHAVLFALDFRMEFKRDVFIDLLGYRKYGHNEGDEPLFTQPLLYKAIAQHPNPLRIYSKKLLSQGLIKAGEVEQMEKKYKQKLEQKLEDSKKEETTFITPFMQDEWNHFDLASERAMQKKIDTKHPISLLRDIVKGISTLPSDKPFIRKIKRLVVSRNTQFEKDKIDWAMAEHLAYGALLQEGFNVRVSGQDVERGTFSHRHAVIKVEDSEEEVILLNQIKNKTGHFSIYNSSLSEYGVLGFEYGYAMANPNTLTIWEAQFGDFSNGAQIVIDQYLSSGEDKWKNQNGLVLFLPHGYEGQGAEHSSARMERYLQLCAIDNMFIANCSTPANLFHLLRRQMKAPYRKPLVVFTPKSLLRHPRVVSPIEEFTRGTFKVLIDDLLIDKSKVKTLVFVTGKFYYDLLHEREKLKRDDVALIRIEQLFPLPIAEIKKVLNSYKNIEDRVWAQEEPKNMGAYGFLLMHLPETSTFRLASRRAYGAPAAGSSLRAKRRHQKVIDSVFAFKD